MSERPWNKKSLADWFETEGSTYIFNTRTRHGNRTTNSAVVVISQIELEVVKSAYDYLAKKGFHPRYRPPRLVRKGTGQRLASAEGMLPRLEEQKCFLTQVLPLMRTERKRKGIEKVLEFIERRRASPLSRRKPFDCPDL